MKGIDRLLALTEHTRTEYTLETSRRLKAALGHPDTSYSTVHITGTNGKGSVATKIATSLSLAGHRAGLFTSPHLVSLEERFVIDGKPCLPQEIERGLAYLFHLCAAHQIEATFFELCSALALHLFAENLVDYGVIEVGMGGRLDATNVITPRLAVITSIGLDHTDRLGSSLEEIAREKGGIIKPSIPLILGPTAQGLGIEEMAEALNAPCYKVEGTFSDFREENRATARLALEHLGLSEGPIKSGCQVEARARFQTFPLNGGLLLIDVAHNPPGLLRLFEVIHSQYPHLKRRTIAAFTQGHDTERMVEICKRESNNFSLVNLKTERGVPLPSARPLNLVWEEALEQWDPSCELLLLCGSCYLAGEAIKDLGIGADSQSGGGQRTTPLEGALVSN